MATQRGSGANAGSRRAPRLAAVALAACSTWACSLVLDLGEPREFAAGATSGGSAGSGAGASGAAGSAGVASGAAGGSAGAAGSSGSSGAAGSGGSSGAAGAAGQAGDAGTDAGYCAADAAPPSPDAGTGLAYFFHADDPSGATDRTGDCNQDDARLFPLAGQSGADCDYAGALSREWIQIFRAGSVACVGCFEPSPDLWAEFLFTVPQQFSAPGAVVFQPLRGAASLDNAVHAAIMIDEQGRLGLSCDGVSQFASQPLGETLIVMLTYEYEFATQSARLWRRSTNEGYAVGQLGQPAVSIQCPCREPADGWFSHGNSGGEMRLDDVRIALDHATIDASY